jgi:hypothetical protein
MELAFPEIESEKSSEGTLAHDVAHAMAIGRDVPTAGVSEEMLDGAELWCDIVSKWKNPHFEEKVECRNIHPDNWGTPDAWDFDPVQMVLKVADYKFGHRHVEVVGNWQLLNYAAGIMGFSLAAPMINTSLKIELTVVQPRSYHKDGPVRAWCLTFADMFPYVDALKANALVSLSPDAPTFAGLECRDCRARHACPTLQSAASASVQMAGQNIPFNLPSAAIGCELAIMREAATLLSSRISGLESEVLARVKSGQQIPGWRVEQGMGREKWSKSVEEVIALGQMMGVDIAKPGVITCKQAIKKGLPADLVSSYTETPTGEIKLVPDDGAKPRAIFGGK